VGVHVKERRRRSRSFILLLCNFHLCHLRSLQKIVSKTS
jgi:hypothetical protein